ncbi:MAG: ThuA domain-containing protein [Pirellulales bacterium]
MRLWTATLAVVLTTLGAAFSRAAEPDRYDQSSVKLEDDAPNPSMTKIILIAGSPSNKTGQHEYFAGCALLMQLLKQSPNVWPVMVKEWPTDEKLFDGAKSIVYYGDGGGKQPFLTDDRWNRFVDRIEKGTGMVLMHQAVDYPAGPQADAVMRWIGGVWLNDIGCRGHWDMDLKLKSVDSPIQSGVKGFSAPADGWLYNMHFDQHAKPLLVGQVPSKSRTTQDAKKTPERDEVIAWSFERSSGGRGFAFTGADLHKSWGYEDQRRFVVNGILWTAHCNVPTSGALVELQMDELNRNLDKKDAPPANK